MWLSIINLIILGITLLVLIWYTIETHRIANQGSEVNLRPIILRTGWISDWDNIQSIEKTTNSSNFNYIEFENLKNIAIEISGYIIIENKKYNLLFGNIITQEKNNENESIIKINLLPKWGWLPAGGKVYASFNRQQLDETKEQNQIYLDYSDIEGNSYFSREDYNFCQISKRLNNINKKNFFKYLWTFKIK